MKIVEVTCTTCNGKGTVDVAYLGSVSYRVLNAVSTKAGITIEDLITAVYGEGGGPASARQSVQVMIKNINRRLANARIVANKKGPGARYRLVTTDGEQHGKADVSRSGNVHRVKHHGRHHGGAAAGKTE